MLSLLRAVRSDIFCYEGRQLPSLFLLGAQKCATSSLATQLFEEWGVSRGAPFHDGHQWSDSKEHHFFDDEARTPKGLSYYAKSFNHCGDFTVDATPNYFFPDPFNNKAIDHIANMYGRERIERTTFAVLLCDPIQRAQSAWYHFHFDKSFRTMVSGFHGVFNHGPYSDLIWKIGRYDEYINQALRRFGSLVIIPAPLYFQNARETISKLLDHANQRNPGGVRPKFTNEWQHAVRPPRENSHRHPKLKDDINNNDGVNLAKYYNASICGVYSYVYGHYDRVTVIPYRPSGNFVRFLETSPVLQAQPASCRYLPGATATHPAPAPSINPTSTKKLEQNSECQSWCDKRWHCGGNNGIVKACQGCSFCR
eukprot:CAMPEP_0119308834 /NCGR_PEP_ID=MMETSP1333-20130426/12799_1 /TAXON_ID=418940 /ORGANISM="Scyphosphaera apsteinii, Strain RCC1455" /LENGTH=366 /DNA_ID=CAMNT_0007312699 /DNA_START=138 /DNA_END=1238 /DNA_ORIENTATION=-